MDRNEFREQICRFAHLDDMLFRGVSSFFVMHTTKRFRVLVMRNYSSEAVFLRYAPGVT